jgi:multidrug efflux system outer membrane protein
LAAAKVDEARALGRAARLDYFPTVTSQGSYNRTHYSNAQTIATLGGPKNLTVLDAELDATWELDLWGRIRRNVKATQADLATAEANRRDAMVSLTGQLASAYLELRGLQMELDVARRNADNQRETLKLTESLLQGGRGTELDTSRARAQLNQTLAAIPSLESAISKDTHRVGVLIGSNPESVEQDLAAHKPLPELPSMVRIGNPAALLQRRPDIIASEEALRAATERIGVATADLFPKVTFNGSAGVQANKFSDFSGPNIGATSFGPGISWPAFNLGRVKDQIDAAGARARGSLATYEKVVISALEETEDALVDFGRQRARTGFLAEAAKDSEQAAKLARERYQNGVADFLTVLDAERTMLQAQSDLANSETSTATALVAIYKALGGGWDAH